MIGYRPLTICINRFFQLKMDNAAFSSFNCLSISCLSFPWRCTGFVVASFPPLQDTVLTYTSPFDTPLLIYVLPSYPALLNLWGAKLIYIYHYYSSFLSIFITCHKAIIANLCDFSIFSSNQFPFFYSYSSYNLSRQTHFAQLFCSAHRLSFERPSMFLSLPGIFHYQDTMSRRFHFFIFLITMSLMDVAIKTEMEWLFTLMGR